MWVLICLTQTRKQSWLLKRNRTLALTDVGGLMRLNDLLTHVAVFGSLMTFNSWSLWGRRSVERSRDWGSCCTAVAGCGCLWRMRDTGVDQLKTVTAGQQLARLQHSVRDDNNNNSGKQTIRNDTVNRFTFSYSKLGNSRLFDGG